MSELVRIGVLSMWLFGKKHTSVREVERKIDRLKEERKRMLDEAKSSTDKLNKELQDTTTYYMFVASGGERRGKR
jgi:hypothetical protein